MGQILVMPVTQILGSKWLIFSLGSQYEKNESFWPKKLGWILIPPVTELFKSKWLNFSLGALRKNLSHFDLKSWVTWVETKIFKFKKNIYCIGCLTG